MKIEKCYKILGLQPTKDEAVIKKAYRKKAFQYHPDRNKSKEAENKFIEVHEAYQHLLLALKKVQPNETQKNEFYTDTRNHPFNSEEERKERYQRAYRMYQEVKQKEAEEYDRYYQSLITGKKWIAIHIIICLSVTLSFLFIVDYSIMPSHYNIQYITHSNFKITYSSVLGDETTPLILDNGMKTWVAPNVAAQGFASYFDVEYTALFNDIKSIRVWQKDHWEIIVPDYSIARSFPLIPIVLLLPLLILFYKVKTDFFIVFFNISFYVVPIGILIILISNDRWYQLFFN